LRGLRAEVVVEVEGVVGGRIGLLRIGGGRLSRIERSELRLEERFVEFEVGVDMIVL